MLDMKQIMQKLAKDRRVFHSEADFQHALAWKINQNHPDAKIRLEYPYPNEQTSSGRQKRQYMDMLVILKNGRRVGVELKYKTQKDSIPVGKEAFHLKGHSARNNNRCYFVSDIWRLEKFLTGKRRHVAYAIVLTNDTGYHKEPRRGWEGTKDAHFRIHEGRILGGQRETLQLNNDGKIPGAERKKIKLRHSYSLKWNCYSSPKNESGKEIEFKYLLVRIPPQRAR